MKRAIGLMAVVVWLSAGCASSEQQARDASACREWAHQQTGYDPGTDTAKGAGVGLAIGAIGGAATGAALGAATGTAPGRGDGYTTNKESYDRAYAACMSGRGSSVSR